MHCKFNCITVVSFRMLIINSLWNKRVLNLVKQVFFLLSAQGSLVDIGAYVALHLGGTPVKRPVLAPLAVYSSTTIISQMKTSSYSVKLGSNKIYLFLTFFSWKWPTILVTSMLISRVPLGFALLHMIKHWKKPEISFHSSESTHQWRRKQFFNFSLEKTCLKRD